MLGALLALAIIQVLPLAYNLMRQGDGPRLTTARIIGAICVISVFAGAGAAAGWLGHPHDLGTAFLHGVGWQGVFGGVLKSGYEVVAPTSSGAP